MKERQLNIELMRIFSMILILIWHIHGHFLPLLSQETNLLNRTFNLMALFISFHVDLFVLITGYFGIKNRLGGVKILVLCVFYALVMNTISIYFGKQVNWNEILLPISFSPWWFMKVYILLALIAPILNTYIKNVTAKNFYITISVFSFISVYLGWFHHIPMYYHHGYDLFNFIQLYLLGRWLKRDDAIVKNLKKSILLPICIFIVCCIIRYKVQPITCVEWTDYSSPLNLLMAISVFCLFLQIRVSSLFAKPVVFLSTSAVAVYLITDYHGVRQPIACFLSWGLSAFDTYMMQCCFIVVFVLVVFLLCCLFDKFRIYITRPINRLVDKIPL